jgi:hypothetical protein
MPSMSELSKDRDKLKQVKDMNKSYTLVQQDTEVQEIQQDIGIKDNFFTYLFVKLDKSKADYQEIYGTDSCDLDSTVFRIFTNKFNRRIEN